MAFTKTKKQTKKEEDVGTRLKRCAENPQNEDEGAPTSSRVDAREHLTPRGASLLLPRWRNGPSPPRIGLC